jgi:hypothetical protein
LDILNSATELDVHLLMKHFSKAVDESLLKSIITIVETTNCRFQEKICFILRGMLAFEFLLILLEKVEQIENIKRVVNRTNKDLLIQIEALKSEIQTLKTHNAS